MIQNSIKVRIKPMDDGALGLLIPAPTGVTYSHQMGGVNKISASVEGFYVPLFSDIHNTSIELIDALYELYGPEADHLTDAGAEIVDKILRRSKKHPNGCPDTSFLSVNRHKLEYSHIGWIHVLLRYRMDYPVDQEDETSWSACDSIECEGKYREGILIFQS